MKAITAAVAIVSIVAVSAACAVTSEPSGDGATTSATAPTTTSASPSQDTGVDQPAPTAEPHRLPPHTAEDLIDLFDPLVAALGFRVTRASLVDLGTYRPAPDGTHLAVYVAPLIEMGPDDHAAAFLPLAAAFLPHVFDRWSDLESFDICQEPHRWPGDTTPPAVTVIDIGREAALDIDWQAVDLAGLIDRSRIDPHVTVTANVEVAASPTWASGAGG